MYHPNKEVWTSEDHHVRFIVTVVNDNILQGLWSESDWKKRSTDIAKAVFEVLVFLRATTLPALESNPPHYEA